jgi:undecaprenyl-diphosphatase
MRGILMLLFIGITITLCDQTTSHLIKNLVQRLRPSHEPTLEGLIYISKAGPGGLYGFVSSHAANCFGLATFIYLTFDNQFKPLKYWLIVWAVLVSYSRIYNGVHYPGDVLVGGLIGITFGFLMAKAYFRADAYILKREQNKK